MVRMSTFFIGLVVCSFLGAQEGPKLPKVSPDVVPAPLPLKESALDKLKNERQALDKERDAAKSELDDTASSSERDALRKKLMDLLDNMKKRNTAPPAPPLKNDQRKESSPEDKKTVKSDPVEKVRDPGNAVDRLSEATARFRDQKYDAALRAFRLIDPEQLSRDQRAFVKYMIGCSYRQTDRVSDALEQFRNIVEEKEDSFIVECALWQIGMIKWRQDLEKQLSDMRSKREAMKP